MTDTIRELPEECVDPGFAPPPKEVMRKFAGGATRDSLEGKLDFEGFLSPLVEESYAKYMNSHRKQADGSIRDSDNWQSGMPRSVYVKSLLRHVWTAWKIHRGIQCFDERDNHEITLVEALHGVKFNTNGLLLELLLGRDIKEE